MGTFDDANCQFGTIAGLNQQILDALVIPLRASTSRQPVAGASEGWCQA